MTSFLGHTATGLDDCNSVGRRFEAIKKLLFIDEVLFQL